MGVPNGDRHRAGGGVAAPPKGWDLRQNRQTIGLKEMSVCNVQRHPFPAHVKDPDAPAHICLQSKVLEGLRKPATDQEHDPARRQNEPMAMYDGYRASSSDKSERPPRASCTSMTSVPIIIPPRN